MSEYNVQQHILNVTFENFEHYFTASFESLKMI